MSNIKKIDKLKLNHWLNIRKTTISVLNNLLKNKLNYYLTLENLDKTDEYSINLISEVLDIPSSYITANEKTPSYIFKTKSMIDKTKRPIERDGIHFYNYYTLPTPTGYIAPVLIDILCPKNKLPKLNNGHLEPAITVNLGPNDIYARFDKKINKTTWKRFKVNKDRKTDWIVGASYFEPSYCVHTYSRATEGPGKILSYTTKSYLEGLLKDKLNDNSFKNLQKIAKTKKINKTFLFQDILNKGFSLETISKETRIPIKKIKNFKLNYKELSKICDLINSDPSNYLNKKFKEDAIGKYWYDCKDSLKTIRKFKSYEVASIAYSTRFPDLFGYFIKVNDNLKKPKLDLIDSNCAHYLSTKGSVKFYIEIGKKIETHNVDEGDAIWVSAFTKHGFSGSGSLVKISDGQNINYLEKVDLMNTYNLEKTLARGRDDNVNWGYDAK